MLYKLYDINRTKWNYKTYNAGSQWGIFNQNVKRIDIKTASYEEIIAFIKEKYASRITLVDGNQTPEVVFDSVYKLIKDKINEQN